MNKVFSKLFNAVKQDDFESVEMILSSGLDINHKTINDLSALYFAKSLKMFKYLISKGADVYSCKDIFFFVTDIEIAKFLLEHYEVKLDEGLSSFHLQSAELTKFLISSGVNPKIRFGAGATALHVADDLELVKYLVEEHGLDVNAKNDYGYTPLHLAHSLEFAKYLVSKGADVNAVSNSGETVFKTNKNSAVLEFLSKSKLPGASCWGTP